jgi:hypothetical protein
MELCELIGVLESADGAVGPLEAIFRTLDFKLMVFGTFAEASTNVGEFVELAVEYGVEHMGRNMAATTKAVQDAISDCSMERLCKPDVGQDEVRGDGGSRNQQSSG